MSLSFAPSVCFGQSEYGPFGELIRATGPMAKVNPFRWSTKYQDDESDLVYYGLRYLKTSSGGWLSRDPEEEAESSPNLYCFVANNPINSFDPLGDRVQKWKDSWTCTYNLELFIRIFAHAHDAPRINLNSVALRGEAPVHAHEVRLLTYSAYGIAILKHRKHLRFVKNKISDLIYSSRFERQERGFRSLANSGTTAIEN
jgi:RHS repeat-associated protein